MNAWENGSCIHEPQWEEYLSWARANGVCVSSHHNGVRASMQGGKFIWVSANVVPKPEILAQGYGKGMAAGAKVF